MEEQEKINIWKRIVNLIKKLFRKDDILLIESPKEENSKIKSDFINELSSEYKILELQKDYENDIIKEEDLSDLDKENLTALYKKQIETLNINIAKKEKEMQWYKEKILEARQKLLLKNKI